MRTSTPSCCDCERTSTACRAGWTTSRSTVPDPWTALSARDDLILCRSRIPEPGRYYDDLRCIVLREGLLRDEERRYLWHELVHADRGDRACHASPAMERSVEREALRRAMPPPTMQWALTQSRDPFEIADLLQLPSEWVDERLQQAPPRERSEWRRIARSQRPRTRYPTCRRSG